MPKSSRITPQKNNTDTGESCMKKKALIFTTADQANFQYTRMMVNSLTKFHSPSDVDILVLTNAEAKTAQSQLPKGVVLEDLSPYLKEDPIFFYRQKPVIAERFMDDYELVLGLDSDQIITGSLQYIFDTKNYDVATVINWNRIDPQEFGFVEMQRIGITPPEYFNCGLVAMRSKKFVHHWLVNCFEKQFQFMQYKEQDILNILCYFGNYNVRCLDHMDTLAKMNSWWGIISKGEYLRAEMRGDDIVIPKGEGDTPFPPTDATLRVLHAGGGNMPNKLNYKTWFKDEAIIKRLDYLVSDTK